jgi:DNA polymerase III delta subunit
MTAEKTRFPASRQFWTDIKRTAAHPTYLLIGEDEGEKEKAIARIIVKVLGEKADSSASGRFHVEMDEFMHAADFALMRSMFSEKKVCVALNIQGMPAGAQSAGVLEEMICARPDGVTLVMTTPENRPPKLITGALLERTHVYHFWRPFEKDMFDILRARLTDAGVRIDRTAAELLVERTGRDTRKLDEAIELIAGAFPGDTLVTGADILPLIEDQSEAGIFQFTDLVFMRDKKAFGLFRKLMDDNTPELVLLGRLFHRAEQIELYHALTEAGARPEEALAKIQVRGRGADPFLEQARLTTPARLAVMFPFLARADFRVKSSGKPSSLEARPLFEALNEIFEDAAALRA